MNEQFSPVQNKAFINALKNDTVRLLLVSLDTILAPDDYRRDDINHDFECFIDHLVSSLCCPSLHDSFANLPLAERVKKLDEKDFFLNNLNLKISSLLLDLRMDVGPFILYADFLTIIHVIIDHIVHRISNANSILPNSCTLSYRIELSGPLNISVCFFSDAV